eukprot:TRINITY_DN15225_c1_g1_i1.p1 TRINITY_DN15225_c1_g1~~TRINITY_DN15225_c1_g1_i1.p1  ORF type:complete len:647 (+),score=145.61 TRINITY_DN15225_c1_g1_i1:104-2044(+)
MVSPSSERGVFSPPHRVVREGGQVTLRMELPTVASKEDLEVDINQDVMRLIVEGKKVEMRFPEDVLECSVEPVVKFSKKKRELTLEWPRVGTISVDSGSDGDCAAKEAKECACVGNGLEKNGSDSNWGSLSDLIVGNGTTAATGMNGHAHAGNSELKAKFHDEAEQLKTQANQAFSAGDYKKAIQLYDEAIDLDPDNHAYYANKAFAQTKLENYAAAVRDATTAIELSPKYIKGYWRRGCAHQAQGNLELAMVDFQTAAKLEPANADTKVRLHDVEKALKAEQFASAAGCRIQAPGNPALLDKPALNPANLVVDDEYTGPRLAEGGRITLQFVEEMMEYFRIEKMLHKRYILAILWQSHEILATEPTLVDVAVPEGTHFTVCGDVHGQYYDLLNIFKLNGQPSEENPYLFNGDFVDRGSFSVETILTLLAFKVLYPTAFHLNRGNHESVDMNKMYGFEGEVREKCGDSMMPLFTDIFQWLPLGHVIGGKVLVVHGGLFSQDSTTLDDVRRVDRHCEPPDEGPMHELLWSDPQLSPGRSPSKRGVGVGFGPDVCARFLHRNGLELLIRSHECKDMGYEVMHDGKTITVFSAPNYCDQIGNKGAYIRFEHDLKPQFHTFEAVPHPPVRPMKYAGMGMFGGINLLSLMR